MKHFILIKYTKIKKLGKGVSATHRSPNNLWHSSQPLLMQVLRIDRLRVP